jgi:hypothetical protein
MYLMTVRLGLLWGSGAFGRLIYQDMGQTVMRGSAGGEGEGERRGRGRGRGRGM